MSILLDRHRKEIVVFWKMTGVMVGLVVLWAMVLFWPDALEYVIGVPAVIAFALWLMTLSDAVQIWMGWKL